MEVRNEEINSAQVRNFISLARILRGYLLNVREKGRGCYRSFETTQTSDSPHFKAFVLWKERLAPELCLGWFKKMF